MTIQSSGAGQGLSPSTIFNQFVLFGLLIFGSAVQAQAPNLTITRAEWQAANNRLVMEGAATTSGTVNLRNAGVGGASLGSASVSNNRWTRTVTGTNPVPCFVSASKSGSLTIQLAVANAPAGCGPQTAAQRDHATMTTYDGPQTCLRCHEDQGRRMHGSVHYQQNGATDFTTNIAGKAGEGPAGRPTPADAVLAINTYCGTHENSPRFTCAGCHVGNGRFQATPAEFATMSAAAQLNELKNIDCLMCHQDKYKRFPDWTAGTAAFEPLTLLNVIIGPNTVPATGEKELIKALGQSGQRTGFSGIPKVDPVTKDFEFRPAGAAGSLQFALPDDAPLPGGAMSLTTEMAAQTAHRTTRTTCLNCHAKAAASDGAKRGDISSANVAPPVALDVHMSPQTGGANLTCSNCHNVNGSVSNGVGTSAHRIRGRGLDLRANDAPRFTCDNAGCHTSAPHGNVSNGTQLNRHTARVACQTCHIPTYAKVITNADGTTSGIPTETVRNWGKTVLSQTACNGRGGWLPEELKGSNLRPDSYQWFDGTSEIYYLKEKLTVAAGGTRDVPTKPLSVSMATVLEFDPGTPAYVLAKPNGRIQDAAAKIYPMKEHWGKLAVNTASNEIVAQSTFEFFRTGSWCRSVAAGLGKSNGEIDVLCPNQNSPLPEGTEEVPVHTYQTLNHGVERQANALGAGNQCNHCHTGNGNAANPKRMTLSGAGGLGYDLREPATNTGLCNNCHGSESWPGFTSGHSEHRNRTVNGRPVTCNSCHLNR